MRPFKKNEILEAMCEQLSMFSHLFEWCHYPNLKTILGTLKGWKLSTAHVGLNMRAFKTYNTKQLCIQFIQKSVHNVIRLNNEF